MNDQEQDNTLEYTLEQQVLDKFKEHIKDSLDSYCRHNNCTLADAGRALNIPRGTLANYQKGKGFPNWDSYFDLMIKIEKGVEPTEERVEMLENNLWDFFAESIKTHCKIKDVTLKDFGENLGFHSSTTYLWVNQKGHLPRQKDFFKALSAIYTGEKAVETMMYPLVNWEKLENGEYHNLINTIISQATGQDYNLPGELDNNSTTLLSYLLRDSLLRTGEILRYFRKGSEKSRDILRRLCAKDKFSIRDIGIEARQILRSEEDYQDWLAMNVDIKQNDDGGN